MAPEEFYNIPPPRVTAQQLFDLVSTHLLKQGKQSVGPDYSDGMCTDASRYLGEDGCKSAIGICIRPSAYRRELEHIPPVELLTELGFSNNLHALACSLQLVHDAIEDVSQWPDNLRKVAKAHDLDYKH